MVIRRALTGAFALLAFAISPRTEAGTETYNFNTKGPLGWTVTSGTLPPPEKPWTWAPTPSNGGGGWQAWRGTEAAGSGSYLVSPCFILDLQGSQPFVRFDFSHRYDFGDGTEASPLLGLGQVQYKINDGDWLGIRDADFDHSSQDVWPQYFSPPVPFIKSTNEPPGGPYDVYAQAGTTNKFAQGDHDRTQFTLTYQPDGPYSFAAGDEIQFRFLVGTRLSYTGTGGPVLDWEIESVQIDGVHECPEPGALALAGIGGLGCLLLVRRRRRSPASRTVLGSTAATVLVAVAVVCVTCAAPAGT